MPRGRVFQAKETACAKALRWKSPGALEGQRGGRHGCRWANVGEGARQTLGSGNDVDVYCE